MSDPATFIATWLTPSSLFIIVNLVIGTIAITSRLTATPNNQHHLVRSPSLLDRVKSFNLRPHYQPQPESESESEYEPEPEPTHPQLVRKPSLLDRVSSFNLSFYKHQPSLPEPECTQPQLLRTPSLLQRVRSMNFSSLYRSDSLHLDHEDPDPKPKPKPSPYFEEKDKAGTKKSGNERECESKEAVERRRPATTMGRVETTTNKEDEEVDLKADDFINRFKKQLKLQRLDSLIRYRDTMASHGRY